MPMHREKMIVLYVSKGETEVNVIAFAMLLY